MYKYRSCSSHYGRNSLEGTRLKKTYRGIAGRVAIGEGTLLEMVCFTMIMGMLKIISKILDFKRVKLELLLQEVADSGDTSQS